MCCQLLVFGFSSQVHEPLLGDRIALAAASKTINSREFYLKHSPMSITFVTSRKHRKSYLESATCTPNEDEPIIGQVDLGFRHHLVPHHYPRSTEHPSPIAHHPAEHLAQVTALDCVSSIGFQRLGPNRLKVHRNFFAQLSAPEHCLSHRASRPSKGSGRDQCEACILNSKWSLASFSMNSTRSSAMKFGIGPIDLPRPAFNSLGKTGRKQRSA